MTREPLFPQIDPLEAEVAFEPLFRACRDLLVFAWERKPTTAGEPHRLLLLAIFARATLTYRAAVHLCRGGYGEQGDMLNRSLFEDMAAAHWVSLHPAEAVERIGKHHQHSRVLWNRMLERHPTLGDPVELSLDEEVGAELDELFGPYGQKSWTGLSMHALVEDIQQLWPDDEGRDYLWRFHDLAHKANNQKLHLSSFALNRVVRTWESDEEVGFQFRASPSIEPEGPVGPALFGAFWIYWQLAGLLCDVWSEPQDNLTALVERHLPAFSAASELFSTRYGRG